MVLVIMMLISSMVLTMIPVNFMPQNENNIMVIERMLLMSIPMTMLMLFVKERTTISMLTMLMLIMLMSMQMKTTMLMLMPAPLTAQLPEGRRRLRLPR